MASWHHEIIAGVRDQFKEAAEAAEGECKRRKAAIEFWQLTTRIIKSFCDCANQKLEKKIFDVIPFELDSNYVCTITYSGPTERVAGLSLDPEQRNITMTIPGESQTFVLSRGDGDVAVALHSNGRKFVPEEIAEELIRTITKIEAGRKFKMPDRRISFDTEQNVELREW